MRRDDAFGLLEAIVSVAIIGAVTIAVFDLVVGMSTRRAADGKRLDRLLQARELLKQTTSGGRLPKIGEQEIATGDGKGWTIRVSPFSDSKLLRQVDAISPADGRPVLSILVREPQP